MSDLEINMDEILDKGLKGKESFFSYLKAIRSELGFKYIFHDKSELIFIIVLLVAVFSFFGLQFNTSNSREIYFAYRLKVYTFSTAPIFYFFICSYSFISSRVHGIYELQATCKYNFYNITAIRMFIFSIVAMIINTLIVVMMFLVKRNFNVMEIIIVSISALFIFSTLYILVLINFKGRSYKYLIMSLWLCLPMLMVLDVTNKPIKLLDEIPLYIHLIITFITALIYIKNLRKLIKVKRGEI
ncbi:membrane protein [Clostridium putrefaciens]|uniref:Membrane protein n=1 Tax=Clostridium putrefaciens TaxID=99675 RepID=A0A381J8F5_9CLOT|nr:hypothetical protein [Clostridium putrefaciens]SUY46978.1 membrane protein [Clostridium putrefaciens]